MIDPRQIVLIVGGDPGARGNVRHLLAAHGLREDDVDTACLILDLAQPDAAELLVREVRAAIDRDKDARALRDGLNGLRQRFERLTAREREVLLLVVSGLLNKQVASKLGISEVTVEIHRSRVMQKMGASSFADLVRMSARITSAISAA
jgi:DNA-binding CsgD family transcriptional regulator